MSSTGQFGYPVVAFSSEDFIGIPVKTPPAVGLLSSSQIHNLGPFFLIELPGFKEEMHSRL